MRDAVRGVFFALVIIGSVVFASAYARHDVLGLDGAVVGLEFVGATSPGLSTTDRARLYYDTTSDTVKISNNGAAFFDVTTSSSTPVIDVAAGDHTIASATATEVTDLSQTLAAGTYLFEYTLLVSTALAATGINLGLNYTGTATTIVAGSEWQCVTAAGICSGQVSTSTTSSGTSTNTSGRDQTRTETTTAPDLLTPSFSNASATTVMLIEGVVIVSDGGDLELWHASEDANTTTVHTGSALRLTRLP